MSEVTVRIPTPLRRVTGGAETTQTTSDTVAECINALETQYPGIKERLINGDGELHRFVNIYVNGEDIRFLQGMETSLNSGDEVSIVPAVAGGRR